MTQIIPNTTAVPQIVGSSQIVVNGSNHNWLGDQILYGAKVIHVGDYSFSAEETGGGHASLKMALQVNLGSGWEYQPGEVASFSFAAGQDRRLRILFHVPYYDGVDLGVLPKYRIVAECPLGEVTLHQAEGNNGVPSGQWKPEYEYQGDQEYKAGTIGAAFRTDYPSEEFNAYQSPMTYTSDETTPFFSISNNRVVWCGGDGVTAHTLVGEVDNTGNITYGSVTNDVFSDTYFDGLGWNGAYLGDGKFVRYHYDGGIRSLAVWDCGSFGLSASLVNTNSGVCSEPSGTYQDGLIYNNGKLSVLTWANNQNRLATYDVSEAGVIFNEQESAPLFGAGRILYEDPFVSGSPTLDGVLYAATTVDIDEESNERVELAYCNTTTLATVVVSMPDQGDIPIEIAAQSDGVFIVAAYDRSEDEMKFICGKVSPDGLSISFGDSVVSSSGQFGSVCGLSVGSGRFVFVAHNATSQVTIPMSTDGTSLYTADQYGDLLSLEKGYEDFNAVQIAQTSDGQLVVGTIGRTGSASFPVNKVRYNHQLDLSPITYSWIPIGAEQTGDIAAEEWKYYKVVTTSGVNSLDILLDTLNNQVDLSIRAGNFPNAATNDGYIGRTGSLPPLEINLSNPGDTDWYIGVLGGAVDSLKMTATTQ